MLDFVLGIAVAVSAWLTLLLCISMVRHGEGSYEKKTRAEGCPVDLSGIAGTAIDGSAAGQNVGTGASGQVDWTESRVGHAAVGRRSAVGGGLRAPQV